jgi:hypothetical protein
MSRIYNFIFKKDLVKTPNLAGAILFLLWFIIWIIATISDLWYILENQFLYIILIVLYSGIMVYFWDYLRDFRIK